MSLERNPFAYETPDQLEVRPQLHLIEAAETYRPNPLRRLIDKVTGGYQPTFTQVSEAVHEHVPTFRGPAIRLADLLRDELPLDSPKMRHAMAEHDEALRQHRATK